MLIPDDFRAEMAPAGTIYRRLEGFEAILRMTLTGFQAVEDTDVLYDGTNPT